MVVRQTLLINKGREDKTMFELEDYKGIQFFHREELVDTSMLEQMGYQRLDVTDLMDKFHITMYYYHPEKPFALIVSVWNLGQENEFFTQIIVSRDILDKLGHSKSLHIYSASNEKKAVVYVGQRKQLLTVFLPKGVKIKCTSYTTLNIIDSQTTRYYDSEMKKRNIVFPSSKEHSISVNRDSNIGFILEVKDKRPVADEVERSLKQKGFRLRLCDADYFIATKVFKTELEAWKAKCEYEDCYYQELKFNPFVDYMSKNFEVAYRALILEDLTPDDVIKKALYEWRTEWSRIVRDNLENVYEHYNIPYIGVQTDANGSMIPDYSNQEEVENFIME